MPEICQQRNWDVDEDEPPRVLCFGDSHTWGVNLMNTPSRRYGKERWPRRLQAELGRRAVVLEDALCGRTTDLNDPKKDERSCYNGRLSLVSAMRAHLPLNGVVLFLGANDCKKHFGRSPEDIAFAVRRLIGVVRRESAYRGEDDPMPVCVIGPPVINPEAPDFEKNYGKLFTASSVLKSMRVGAEVVRAALCEPGVQALNAASFADTNDGLHINVAAHLAIAEYVGAWVETEVLGASALMDARYASDSRVLVT